MALCHCAAVMMCCCNALPVVGVIAVGTGVTVVASFVLQAAPILASTKPNMIAMAALGPFVLGTLVPAAGQEWNVHIQGESNRAGVYELALIGITFGEPLPLLDTRTECVVLAA